MIGNNQKRLLSLESNQGSETKLVVKRRSAGREFAQLPVPVKHPQMCSVGGSAGRGESSNRRQETGRSLSRATITSWEVA